MFLVTVHDIHQCLLCDIDHTGCCWFKWSPNACHSIRFFGTMKLWFLTDGITTTLGLIRKSGLLIDLSEEVCWEVISQGRIGVAWGQLDWLGYDALL